MKYIQCIIIASSFLIASHQAAAKVYKWTDAKGQTHFSEHAPANQETEVIKPNTGHSDPVDYASDSTSSTAAAPKADSNLPAQNLKDPERCASAQQNKNALQNSARVRIKDDNGEYRYLTPSESQQRMTDAVEAIEESCD